MQNIEPDRVFGVVFTPFVAVLTQRLEDIVVARSETTIGELLRCACWFSRAEIRCRKDGTHDAFGRDRVRGNEFPIAQEHAAEILRPRPVRGSIEDYVTDMSGAQILGFGREGQERVNLTLHEQFNRLERGLVMFLTCCSPRSSKAMSRRSRTCSCAAALRQIPPGSASASRRAAMLTPSPKMSPSSMMMSPTLMPMRNSMRRATGRASLRAAISRCTSTAQRTASTTLANSARRP